MVSPGYVSNWQFNPLQLCPVMLMLAYLRFHQIYCPDCYWPGHCMVFSQVVHTGHNPPACPLLQATSAAQASASLWHTLSHTQRHIQSRRDTHSYIVTLTATQRHTQPHSHTQSHRDTHSHTETHTQSHTESQTHTRTHRLTWDRVLLHCCTVGFPPHQKIASS